MLLLFHVRFGVGQQYNSQVEPSSSQHWVHEPTSGQTRMKLCCIVSLHWLFKWISLFIFLNWKMNVIFYLFIFYFIH